eukprot:CAMPEP_0113326658 /NCGR_PEP_ID=MMETSP0010_2-20120614/18688_1 /TAXON_ID=216773 ORGANISM="Corethron hystrix, Strain 308" /NCGR_SAMPLE_ID=MMETSP0010_2 /ASSEMBLY_ACC=CAM_ASM_000155 /LENGTH=66 /DNA_ID=CAMNT_0000187103 /DNA_START=187 /DNA_END=383 /DNA_ORIENTATION=+ /assembly_acc=CAM_ASM_000155
MSATAPPPSFSRLSLAAILALSAALLLTSATTGFSPPSLSRRASFAVAPRAARLPLCPAELRLSAA